MESKSTLNWRPLRLSAVATLILLSLQAWSGDFVNVFITTGSKAEVNQSVAGFFQAVTGNGVFVLWHGMEGLLILGSAIGVLVVSLRYDRRSVKIAAGLGLLFILIAGLGGYFFVLSGFSAGGSSMQMGGSFIGSYAMYFITLYYTK
ncbi:MAG: hypothetical protein OK455_06865 [Thaumarchaeota archaeon]|nr:hypothetical protein [Nitrososphaerota archaeon]